MGATQQLYGSFMAPALTAPSVSQELDLGAWDLLRMTPQPTFQILLAKMMGGLARLRIWNVLLGLSLLESAIWFLGIWFSDAPFSLAVLLALTTVVRPFLEILFAGLLGTYFSTWMRSARAALTATYGSLVLFRLLNNLFLWGWLAAILGVSSEVLAFGPGLAGTLAYVLVLIALLAGLRQRVGRMESGLLFA